MSEEKICPFLNGIPCKEEGCKVFHPKVRDCSLTTLPYNTYLLNKGLDSLRLIMIELKQSIDRQNREDERPF